MYENIQSCVQTDPDSYSETFQCNKGIRQGDNLSPILFSTFLNDMPQILKDNCCPGLHLEKSLINFLMFAADLVIVSSTPEGLQKYLNTIHSHAKKWKLKVNSNKI